MALVKTPGGEFYVDDTQFKVDYNDNSIIFIGGGGSAETVEEHNDDPDAHQAIEFDCGNLG